MSQHAFESPTERLGKIFGDALADVTGDGKRPAATVTLTKPTIDADYQCNDAFQYAKQLHTNPRDIAQNICDRIEGDPNAKNVIETLEVAGPGFINIRLRSSWLLQQAVGVASSADVDHGGLVRMENTARPPRKVLLDFASPNMSKELHVGHLRSSVIGDTLARVLSSQGDNVERVSHVGDWGPPMAMVIEEMRESAHPSLNVAKSQVLSDSSDGRKLLPKSRALGEAYVRAKTKLEKSEKARDRVAATLQELQQSNPGDEDSIGNVRHAWWILCEASRRACADVLRRLDVRVHERGESTYESSIDPMLDELDARGLTESLSNGALRVVLGSGEDPDTETSVIVRRSDGTSLYATTDLAALKHRLEAGVERIVYVTDHSQAKHFADIFRIGKVAGWFDSRAGAAAEHCSCGLVKGDNNRKLSSRSGDAPSLSDLLDDAKAAAVRHVRSHHDANGDVGDESVDRLAETIMRGAVRYFELSHSRKSDYAFSPERMLELQGNTSIALIYACARIRSLRDKAAADAVPMSRSDAWHALLDARTSTEAITPQERSVMLILARYPDILESVSRDLMPHYLCEYLHQLASDFHSFYSNVRILDAPNTTHRLALCVGVDAVLRSGLGLLGVPVPDERM
eukprot:g2643.t1